jgi:hypothetical protein
VTGAPRGNAVRAPWAVLAVFGLGLLLAGCEHEKAPVAGRFVQLNDSGFVLEGKPFFPMAVNYIISFRWDGEALWCGPASDYQRVRADHFTTKDSTLQRFRADMELIKDMGFNTVRLVGLSHDQGRNELKDSLGLKAGITNDRDTVMLFADESTLTPYFPAVAELLAIVEAAGLKAILLTWTIPDVPASEVFMGRLMDRLMDNSTILAFDLFNEPLYFDRLERPKTEAIRIVERWRALMDEHAPNHLFTIGHVGIREVFEFDPHIIDVDFISFHPYEYEPEQVRNEMAWYGKELHIPWIIGETAVPADNDSVPYSDQADFARSTLQQAFACGAKGYSWWQFKDVAWNNFHADYMGVVSREGESRTKASGLLVQGTPKPVTEVFRTFDPQAPKGPCACMDNYFNYSGHHASRIIGKLVDIDGKPIRTGVFLGWNEWWSRSYHTVTQDDGSFELLGDFQFHHWMVSGLSYSMKRGDPPPGGFKPAADGIPTFDLGTITLYELDWRFALRERLAYHLKPLEIDTTGKEP